MDYSTYNSNLTDKAQDKSSGQNAPELPLLFQEDPIYDDERGSQHSWTRSIKSYMKNASHLAACARLNQTHYRWTATINITREMPAEDVISTWTNITRNMTNHNLTCLWVREITPDNRIHYHLIVKSKHTKRELKELLRQSIPDDLPHRIHVEEIKVQQVFPRYIFKANTWDHKKRLLFKPKLGITKHHTTGDFWYPSRKALSNYIMERYHWRPKEGLVDDDVRHLAYYVWKNLFGGTDELMSLHDIRTHYGFLAAPECQSYWDALEELKRGDDIEAAKQLDLERYDNLQVEIQRWKECNVL